LCSFDLSFSVSVKPLTSLSLIKAKPKAKPRLTAAQLDRTMKFLLNDLGMPKGRITLYCSEEGLDKLLKVAPADWFKDPKTIC
jgi:hypothetical protein